MRNMHTILAITATAMLLAGCARDSDMPTDQDAMAAATGSAMSMDSTMMRRHTQEMDSMSAAVQTHVTAMRTRTADQWHAGMSDHVKVVGGLFSMMDRHMGQMGMHAGGAHAQHDGMMHEGHGEMMTAAAQLKQELGTLQTADRTAVATAMRAHLDRIEAFLALMARNHQQQRQGH